MSLPAQLASMMFAVFYQLGGPMLSLGNEPAPHAADWHITVDNQTARTTVGDRLTYQVTVHGTSESQVTVRVALPGTLRDVQAAGASVVGQHVAWRSQVQPGTEAAFAVSATVTEQSEAGDLPVTACVQLPGADDPVRCASDTTALAATDDSPWWAWTGSIFFGLLAVVSAVWLQKKITPDLLTPQNAHHGFEPGRPGGAPSA